MLYCVFEGEVFRAIVQGPSEQEQVIEDRLRKEACLTIEVYDDGVEGFRGGLQVRFFGDGVPELKEGSKVFLLEVLIEFAFAEFC